MDDDAKAALQKLADAVRISDGDSLGALNPDRMVIWNATSSWQGSVSITLGDLRALTKQLRYEHCVKDRVQAFAAFYPDERLLEHYRSLVAQQLPEPDAEIDAALLEFKRRGITV